MKVSMKNPWKILPLTPFTWVVTKDINNIYSSFHTSSNEIKKVPHRSAQELVFYLILIQLTLHPILTAINQYLLKLSTSSGRVSLLHQRKRRICWQQLIFDPHLASPTCFLRLLPLLLCLNKSLWGSTQPTFYFHMSCMYLITSVMNLSIPFSVPKHWFL